MKLVSLPGGLAAFEHVHLSAAVPPCSLIAMRNRGLRELFKLVVFLPCFFCVRLWRHVGEVVLARRLPLPRVLQPCRLGSGLEVCELQLRGATSIAHLESRTKLNGAGVTCNVVQILRGGQLSCNRKCLFPCFFVAALPLYVSFASITLPRSLSISLSRSLFLSLFLLSLSVSS